MKLQAIFNTHTLRVMAIPFLTFPLLTMACKNSGKAVSEISDDSLAVEVIEDTEALVFDSVPEEAPAKKSYTSFTVNSRNIRIPGLEDLKPITDKFSSEGRQIKSITFYGLTPSIGMGSMADDSGPYMRAKTFREAKNYAQVLMEYEFDRDGNIEELNMDAMEGYEFKHDSSGRPVEIKSESDGYRGSPSYVVKYSISWSGDTPTSINRKIEEFESEFSDSSELEFETDFTGRTSEFVNSLVRHTGSKAQVSGNTCKLMGEEYPVWCEVTYY